MILEAAEMDGGSEQKKRDLGRINAAGKHLLALVNDVLDISGSKTRKSTSRRPSSISTCLQPSWSPAAKA